jgi:hypothetical protein
MVEAYQLQTSGRRQFIFNLSANVGTKSPNRPDDVALVQLGFRALARSQDFSPGLQDAEVFAAVPWDGACSERTDDPLVRAIRRYQSIAPNGVVDGHVSTIKDSDGIFRLGSSKGTYILADLTAAIIEVHGDLWPRIDRIEGCPQALRNRVAELLDSGGSAPTG